MRIGIDVDGVLANFSQGYADLIRQVSGRDLFTQEEIDNPSVWDWDLKAGYTKDEIDRTWDQITSSYFWADLKPMKDAQALLWSLFTDDNEVYFITNRMGQVVQLQTVEFLRRNNYPTPCVIISGRKGDVCNALGITHYIDDKKENIADVTAKSPMTEAYLLSYRHNEDFVARHRVYSLDEFAQAIGLEVPLGPSHV